MRGLKLSLQPGHRPTKLHHRLPQLAKSLGQSRKAFKDGMREAEEEAEMEAGQRQLNSNVAAPQITAMSDEELMAEMRRRTEAKQQS